MRRWLLIIGSVLLVCVVVAVVGGRMLLGRIREELSEPMVESIASSVEASVARAIQTQSSTPDEIRLTALDFDINTAIGPYGESGFEVTTNGDESTVVIYGAATAIDQSGITVSLADLEYHAMPAIHNGRVDFESSDSDGGLTGWMLDIDGIEEGLETGLNDTLADHDLIPVQI